MSACSGGSDAAPTASTSTQTIAARFDEQAVKDAATEMADRAAPLGLTARAGEVFFRGCGSNAADEPGRPQYFYVVTITLDAPIGGDAPALDVDAFGDEATAAGWSQPDGRGSRRRDGMTLLLRSIGPRLVVEVHGPCLTAIDDDAAREHQLGEGRQRLDVPGAVDLSDEPIPLGDGTYLPAGDPLVTIAGS